jgi:hypothetical protein
MHGARCWSAVKAERTQAIAISLINIDVVKNQSRAGIRRRIQQPKMLLNCAFLVDSSVTTHHEQRAEKASVFITQNQMRHRLRHPISRL